MSEGEPNATITVETSRAFEWGSNVAFRYWLEGKERAPLSEFQANHLGAVLRHVARLIEERAGKPEQVESARRSMDLSEAIARRSRREWEESVVELARDQGVHAAASVSGLKESEVQTLLKRSLVTVG